MIDTNVVFEGLTTQEVLASKLSEHRWQRLRPVLGSLLDVAEFVPIYFTWRPVSPDPADEHVIDCAMNAAALVVTWNVRDFRLAERELGLPVRTPVQFLRELTRDPTRETP